VTLPDRAVLDNGAVVISQPLSSNPFIAFRGSVPAGTVSEGTDFGVAEFASRLLLGGTRRASAAKLADRLEGIGATLEFHNSQELLVFSGRCTRETVSETVRILVECLSQPAFSAKEVERVRGELLNDHRIEEDDPRQRAYGELLRIVFPRSTRTAGIRKAGRRGSGASNARTSSRSTKRMSGPRGSSSRSRAMSTGSSSR